jgi:addiction module HigA family antidote
MHADYWDHGSLGIDFHLPLARLVFAHPGARGLAQVDEGYSLGGAEEAVCDSSVVRPERPESVSCESHRKARGFARRLAQHPHLRSMAGTVPMDWYRRVRCRDRRLSFGASTSEERLPNITPGEILREEFLSPMGITAYRLAKDTGMPPTGVSRILKGRRRVTADTPLRLRASRPCSRLLFGSKSETRARCHPCGSL